MHVRKKKHRLQLTQIRNILGYVAIVRSIWLLLKDIMNWLRN